MSGNSVASDLLASGDTASLFGSIDIDRVHGLNLSVPEDAKAIIKPWDQQNDDQRWAESGVDDQIIIHVPFVENVKLKSVVLKLGRGEVAPTRLRVYPNRPTIIDFSEAESTTAKLDISLLEGQTDVVEYPLRVAAFASVNSVSIFLSDSVGGEVSRIYYLGFKGTVSAPKKDPNTHMEVPAADKADAPLVDKVSERVAASQGTAR